MFEESEEIKTEALVPYTGHKEEGYEDLPLRWMVEPTTEVLDRCAKLTEMSKNLKTYTHHDNTEHTNDQENQGSIY